MDKKSSNEEQEINNLSFEERKKRNSSKKVQIREKRLPWWVELLFVQIGFPDRWLIKVLKTKKNLNEFYKNDKKYIFTILLFIFGVLYLQPVIRYSKIKVKCHTSLEKRLLKLEQTKNLSKVDLRLIANNICSGGEDINFINFN